MQEIFYIIMSQKLYLYFSSKSFRSLIHIFKRISVLMEDIDHSLSYKIWWYHQTQVVCPPKNINLFTVFMFGSTHFWYQ